MCRSCFCFLWKSVLAPTYSQLKRLNSFSLLSFNIPCAVPSSVVAEVQQLMSLITNTFHSNKEASLRWIFWYYRQDSMLVHRWPEKIETSQNVFIKIIPDRSNSTYTVEDSDIANSTHRSPQQVARLTRKTTQKWPSAGSSKQRRSLVHRDGTTCDGEAEGSVPRVVSVQDEPNPSGSVRGCGEQEVHFSTNPCRMTGNIVCMIVFDVFEKVQGTRFHCTVQARQFMVFFVFNSRSVCELWCMCCTLREQ